MEGKGSITNKRADLHAMTAAGENSRAAMEMGQATIARKRKKPRKGYHRHEKVMHGVQLIGKLPL